MSGSSMLRFPKNDDVFEDLCLDLYREILEDPFIQRNGSRGYEQNGVDICSDKGDGRIIGIQCKQKDILKDKKLKEKEVVNEVNKAKSFKPPLSEYIITTTALKDPKIQELAREITKKHKEKGLFSVKIQFWEDISHHLSKYPTLLENYDLVTVVDKTKALKGELKDILAATSRIEKNISLTTNVSNNIPPLYTSSINHAKELLESSKADDAFKFLDKIKNDVFSEAPPIVKYEILRLMGVAKQKLDQNFEAGKLLINAYKYNKDDEKARTSKAWGYLLLDELDKARYEAKNLLKEDYANIDAYQILIYSSPDKPLEDITSEINPNFRESKDIAYSIGLIAREREDFLASEEWFRKALKNDDTEKFIDLQGSLGEVILINLLENQLIVYTKQINHIEKQKLEEAKGLLDKAWDNFSSDSMKKSRISWIINRSLIKKLLGDLNGSLADLDMALKLNPSNQTKIRKIGVLFEMGKVDEAKSILDDLDEKEFPEKPLFLAKILFDRKKYDETIPILENILKNNPSKKLKRESTFSLLDIYISKKDYENARIIYKTFSDETEDIKKLVYAARISDLNNDPDHIKSDSLLDKAIKQAKNSNSVLELSFLADELYSLDKFTDAAKIYEKFVDEEINTEWVCKLVTCYYQSGDIGKAFNICKKLREIYDKPLPYISEIELAIYTEIDDFKKAKTLTDIYLKSFPSNLNMKLNQAIINLHYNDFSSVDDFLNSEIDLNKLSLNDFIRLASICHLRGNKPKKLLKILYEMRRKYFGVPMAHAEYVKFLSFENIIEMITPIRVDLDTAFCLEYKSGEKKWYVLDDRKNINIALAELNLEHSISKKVYGRYLGEKIKIERGPTSEIVKIIDIKSKYVYALQKSSDDYSEYLPDYGIYPIHLGTGKDKFKTVLDQSDKKQKLCISLENLYNAGKISMGSFSKYLKANVIDIWMKTVESKNLSICNTSSSFNLNKLLSFVDCKSKLVVDLISLLTLFKLNIQDIIVETFGKLRVSQSTLDTIQICIYEQRKFKNRDCSNLAKIGDNYVMQTVTADAVKKKVEYLEKISSWIHKNCEILPCTYALNLKRSYRTYLNQEYGKPFIDTLLIAAEEGNILVCEEEIIRLIGKKYFGITGIWVYIILIKCFEDRILNKNKVEDAISKLIDFNYFFVP